MRASRRRPTVCWPRSAPRAGGRVVSGHGPAGDNRYVWVWDGERYWATEPTTGAPAGMPTAVPEDRVREQIEVLGEQFAAAVGSFDEAAAQVGADADPDRVGRVGVLRETFDQIRAE